MMVMIESDTSGTFKMLCGIILQIKRKKKKKSGAFGYRQDGRNDGADATGLMASVALNLSCTLNNKKF